MSSKKGKKGKKEKKPGDTTKVTNVDRTFYELTIADLNQKLSHLRSHLQNLDDTNCTLSENLKALEEDRTDVSAHLERVLAERQNTILELEERLIESEKVRESEKSGASDKIKELEAKFKSMNDQLTSEIQLLNGKLNSLDEFRVQRDSMMAKFENQELEMKNRERTFKDRLYAVEQRSVVEKEQLKKEAEKRLLQVSAEFTQSLEIRMASYTRRLIRENIALRKEVDNLFGIQAKLQKDLRKEKADHEAIKAEHDTLAVMKNQLIRTSSQKGVVIEKITQSYNQLKAKYTELIKYKAKYEQLISRDVTDHLKSSETTRKLCKLGQKAENYKLEMGRMRVSLHQVEVELSALRRILAEIENAVQAAIGVYEQQPKAAESEKKNLLDELVEILCKHRNIETGSVLGSPRAVYQPGSMGITSRKRAALMEALKRQLSGCSGSVEVPPETEVKIEPLVIPDTEKPRSAMLDVEFGPILYVSADGEDEEMDEFNDDTSDAAAEDASSARTGSPLASPNKDDEDDYDINLFY